MSIALHLFENLTEIGEDLPRARLLAEAFEQIEDRYPQIKEIATQSHVRESELRLQLQIEGVRLEIEGVRLEIRETEGRLQKEIEGVRLEIRETEGRLQKEIEGVRLEIRETEGRLQKEIEGVRLEIRETEGRLAKEIEGVRTEIAKAAHRQTLWMIGAIGAIVGLIRLMDFFLHNVAR